MRRTAIWRVTTALGAVALLTFPVIAQEAQTSGGSSIEQQLQSMQEEMDRLRTDNSKMRDEIDDLRSSTQDNWLTEQRTAEIRGIVQDVLADADTRASLLNDGLTAGWSNGFFLASPDGRFLLSIDGMTQIRYMLSYTENSPRYRDGFELDNTRLTFRGHMFTPDFTYLVRGQFQRNQNLGDNVNLQGGFMQLLDAWVRYNFTQDWSVRVGQFKLPFNREELVSESQQELVERSLVNQFMSIGRSQGVEFTMLNSTDRWATTWDEGGSSPNPAINGVVGGPRTNSSAIANNQVDYSFTSRYDHLFAGTWQQFEDFTSPRGEEYGMMMGIAAHYQESDLPQGDVPWFTATVDLSVEWGGANAFAAIIYSYIDSPGGNVNGILQSLGIVGQFGVYVAPKWEVFVRGEYLQFEVTASPTQINFPDLGIISGGVNYYIEGHDVKWTTDIGVSLTEVSGIFASEQAGWRPDTANEGEVVFRTQLQLLF
jgi:hypothetical protein